MRFRDSEKKLLYPFVFSVMLLLGLGLVTLYSASYPKALQLGLPSYYFIRRQLLFTAAGIFGALFLFLLPRAYYSWFIFTALSASLILMLLTQFTSLGAARLGARRWMQIGPFSFQPSELVKLSVLLFLANFLGRQGTVNTGRRENPYRRTEGYEDASEITGYRNEERKKLDRVPKTAAVFLIPAAVVLLFTGLIALQRDFSTAALFLFICLAVMAVGGVRLSYLLYSLAAVIIPGMFILLNEEYRLRRIIGFLYPELDPAGMSYQVSRSTAAVQSGGVLGKGVGQGTMKIGAVPEIESDFIFSAFAEEFGLIGVLSVLFLFAVFAYTGAAGAGKHRGEDNVLFLAGFGGTFIIFWQMLLHVSVTIGILPPTGIPLPFFSLGGTNLVVNLVFCGIIAKSIYVSARETEAESYLYEHDSNDVDGIFEL